MTNELTDVLKRVQARFTGLPNPDPDPDLRVLFEAFQRQQYDLEQLALAYASLLNKNTPLVFYSRQVAASIRPAKKGRAYVSASAADGLAKAIKEYGKQDAANRLMEQPVVISEPPLSEQTTKTEEPKVIA